ncbi:MAG TPA: ribonuclease III, partial [Devosia sp.]|nr:ribonuclease III [Devosia sp.]
MPEQLDITRLETILHYSFCDKSHLVRAITHTSAISPGKRVAQSYQRLEFLGDRVLGLVVADLLFKRFPGAKEGELARALNSVVRKEACAAVAVDLGLGAFILMDKSELRNGGREKSSVLADVCEAIIGAIYLD